MKQVARVTGNIIRNEPLDVTDIDLATFLAYEGLSFTTRIDRRGITHYQFDSIPESLLETYPFSDVQKVLSLYHSLYRLAKFNKQR